mgnify:CR=1 FL=1
MTNKEAINLLVQVAHLAQERGLLKLNDAVTVAQAITTLQPKEEVKDSAEEVK